MRNIILATLLVGAAAPAFAQEAETVAPGVFTGLRVEGLVGYENGDGPEGVAYGVGAGFDFDLGSAVAGLEAEYADSTTDVEERDTILVGDRLSGEAGRDLYVGGRIGAKVSPSTLLYVKGGYTNLKLRATYDSPVANVADVRLTEKYDGVRVGGGVEQLLGRNAFAKAEYRYSNYEAGAEKHQGLVGLGIRF